MSSFKYKYKYKLNKSDLCQTNIVQIFIQIIIQVIIQLIILPDTVEIKTIKTITEYNELNILLPIFFIIATDIADTCLARFFLNLNKI